MPSKRKATSPASKPESSSASRKSKRLAAKPDPVVAPPADSDFEESEPVLSTKKKSTRRTTEKEAVDSQSKRRAVENSGSFVAEKTEPDPDPDPEVEDCAVESDFIEEVDETEHGTLKKSLAASPSKRKPKRGENVKDEECVLYGEPVPDAEARQRWPHRYNRGKANGTKSLNGQDDSDQQLQAKCHFTQASVDGQIYCLEDDAHVKAADGEEDYICKIVEFFEAVDGMQYFTAQWFYRAKDTVIKSHDQFIDKKRVFLSEIMDDNPIDCLVIKLKIVPVPSNATLQFKENAKSNCDFYYDMMYLLPYSSFLSLPPDSSSPVSSSSTISSDTDAGEVKEHNLEKKLLDLYSGCGAMSTGLCLGANSNGVKLVTKWAVDLNSFACDSLRLNHPETQVRNEYASDFLSLLKEWMQLCSSCSLVKSSVPPHPHLKVIDEVEEDENADESEDSGVDDKLRPGLKPQVVAVKVLDTDGLQGHKEWLTEIIFLGQLRHPHLVKLIGYCWEDNNRLLVYEFLPRGSLENQLFGKFSITLSWSTRMKIALGAAKGLAFLHEGEKPVIYRDFKASNILINSDYTAKLSDFGLAKDGPAGDDTHVSTRIMGTHGYAAPEYIMTGHLTTMSDVYSFGVVLLEMLTGKRSLDKKRREGETNLVEWLRPYLKDPKKIARVMDRRLEGEYPIKGAQTAALVAYKCLSHYPKPRPTMDDVVKILETLQEESNNTDTAISDPMITMTSNSDFSSESEKNGEKEDAATPERNGRSRKEKYLNGKNQGYGWRQRINRQRMVASYSDTALYRRH